MGTSTPAGFALKMNRLATDIRPSSRVIADRSAFVVKTSVQTQLLAAGVTGGKLRGVGKKGAKIGVRYRLHTDWARVFMYGPAQLIERDTKPHRIPRPTRGRRQTRNTKPVVIPGVGVRQYAMHPGTPGKHPWAKGVIAARPLLDKVAGQIYFGAVKKAIR